MARTPPAFPGGTTPPAGTGAARTGMPPVAFGSTAPGSPLGVNVNSTGTQMEFSFEVPGNERVRIVDVGASHQYSFLCGCSQSDEHCPHIEYLMKNRLDASFWQAEDKTPHIAQSFSVGVPILFNPRIAYWVHVEPLEEDPTILVVKHNQALWTPGVSKKDSVILSRVMHAVHNGSMDMPDELCILMPGDSALDILTSLQDAFSAWHVAHKPEYKCKANRHNYDRDLKMRSALTDAENRGPLLMRLFFTETCHGCAKVSSTLTADQMRDLIPRLPTANQNHIAKFRRP